MHLKILCFGETNETFLLSLVGLMVNLLVLDHSNTLGLGIEFTKISTKLYHSKMKIL